MFCRSQDPVEAPPAALSQHGSSVFFNKGKCHRFSWPYDFDTLENYR